MFRARFPFLVKIIALGIFFGVAWQLGTHLIKRLNPTSTSRRPPSQLPGQLTAVFDAFKYVHHEDGRTRYILTATKDKVFGDGHHDLSEVKLQIFDKTGAVSGQVTAEFCRYDQSQAFVRFEKNVLIETADGLKVKTEVVNYNQQAERAETEEAVEFVRGRAHGTCKGMLLDSIAQRLEMKAAVHIIIDPETSADSAEKSDSDKGSDKQTQKADKKKEKKKDKKAKKEKKNKPAETTVAGSPADVLSKSGNVGSVPIEITGNWAEYTGKDRVIKLRGNARLAEPERSLSASALTAFLSPTNQVERVEARGNSLLVSNRVDMPARVKSQDMDFFFDAVGNFTKAEARRGAEVKTTAGGGERELTAEKIELFTQPGASGNEVQHIKATENVHLEIAAPPESATNTNPSAKDLTAQVADIFYHPGGRFLKVARAKGGVVVTVTPVKQAAGAQRNILRAERCNLEFFEAENAARQMSAEGETGVKIEVIPHEPVAAGQNTKPPQITQSRRANALFNVVTGGIETAVQEGDFKYDEGARHAIAERANYDSTTSLIELRGGKVAVWDEAARTQADEIDLFTVKQESMARGRVRSTYYNPGTTGQATPFRNMQSPVFITAKEARSFHTRGEAIYTGDARAWQDDSFLSAERLELYREGKRCVATGNVSSALYQSKRNSRSGGAGERGETKKSVPVFATSNAMTYSDADRLAEYTGSVKMKQGDERLEAERVKIFLESKTNEIERMEAIERVLLVQPGRQAEGDRAEYTALEERTVIIGNMAKVVSQAQGSVTGRRLTLMGGDDKIFVDDQRGAKRVKSTHEVRR